MKEICEPHRASFSSRFHRLELKEEICRDQREMLRRRSEKSDGPDPSQQTAKSAHKTTRQAGKCGLCVAGSGLALPFTVRTSYIILPAQDCHVPAGPSAVSRSLGDAPMFSICRQKISLCLNDCCGAAKSNSGRRRVQMDFLTVQRDPIHQLHNQQWDSGDKGFCV